MIIIEKQPTDYYMRLIFLLHQGFRSIQSNIGRFDFWGHEFGVETKNFVGEFNWSTSLTLTLDRNIVKKLGKNDTPIGGYQENLDYVRTEVGHPIGQFYGYVYEGVFMNEARVSRRSFYYTVWGIRCWFGKIERY